MTTSTKRSLRAIDFRAFIEEHRELLKPPVGNRQIWEDGELIAMVIGGPNQRTDYHDDREEFFYQIEGDMVLQEKILGANAESNVGLSEHAARPNRSLRP